MGDLVPFPGGSGAGGGPDDPMLEDRVAELEARSMRVEEKLDALVAAIQRLDPAIREAVGELKDTRRSITQIQVDLAKVEGRVAGYDARFAGIDARFNGLSERLSGLPTTFTLLALLLTTWGGGIAIVFSIVKFAKP